MKNGLTLSVGGSRMGRYLRSKCLFLFVFIPFFKPVCFQYYSSLQSIEQFFILWKVMAAGICLMVLAAYIWNVDRVPKLTVLVFLFECSIIVSTIYHQGELTRAAIDAVSIVSYTAFLALELKYNGRQSVHLMSSVMAVLLVLNLFSEIIFPGGMPADLYTNPENTLYFMVVDNGSALFLTFCIVLFVIDGMISYGRVKTAGKILIFFVVFSAVLSHSATAVITVILICAIIIFIIKSDFSEHQNSKVLFMIYVILFVYLITMQDNFISRFILQKIFQRSGDFTGRYYLWEQALNMIKEQPWLGYGRVAHDYIEAWGGYFSSHNYVLEMLLQGGVIALSIFICCVGYVIKKAGYTQHMKITCCLLFALFTALVASLMEATVHSVYVFGILVLCSSSYYLEKA